MRGAHHLAVIVCLSVFGSTAIPVLAQCDAAWQTAIGVSGASTTVWSAFAVDEPSAIGPAVYAGGQFTTIGGVSAANIARWNGTTWAPLGTGTQSTGVVYAFAEKDGYLYAGGAFASMGAQAGTRGIAKWDGTTWSSVGGGMAQNNGGPRALRFWGNDLYVGGLMNDMGGVSLRKLARWDGSSWAALPGNPLASADSVSALIVHDDGAGAALYVGGDFDNAGGNANNDNIFRWDGSSLTALGRGTNDIVEALAEFNGDLYVGGHFTKVFQSDGTELIVNKIARWDGTTWHVVSGGIAGTVGVHVWSLNVFNDGTGDALYAGGNFSTVSSFTIRNVAKWNGTTWSVVGASNLNGGVYALTTSQRDGGQYVGGTFTTAGTPSANRIVRWGRNLPFSPQNAAASPEAISIGESSTLSASVAGSTMHWYTGSCGGTEIGTGDTLAVSPTQTTTYYARAHNGTCYSYACDAVTVTVECTPPAPTDAAANPTTVYIGDSSTLSASAPGSTIHWYTGGCGVTQIGTGGLLQVTPAATTTYYARAFNGTCFSDTCDEVTVTVDCTPDAPANAAADPDVIFIGDSSTLSASVPGSTIYWYTGGCGSNDIGTGDSLLVTPAATTTYYARAFNGTCFSEACGSVTVTVECAPSTPDNASAEPAEIIIGGSSTLSASVAGSTIYWYTGACGSNGIGTGDSIEVSPVDTTTYYARAFNGTCFSDACDAVTVTVICPPTEFTQQPQGGVVCVGHPHQMCVDAQGTGAVHYQWRRNGLTLIGASSSCYTATNSGTYSCVATDDCGPSPSSPAVVRIAAPQVGDLDGDGDADLDDFARLADCTAGPGQGVPVGCECFNIVTDGQFDLADFAAFQTMFAPE
jgi:hypothetical protein